MLINIGYKYDTWKVIYFIVTKKSGSTQAGFTYLSKYTDKFTNVDIFPVACTLVMYKFFGAVDEIESHKKSRQSDFALEKFCVTQCGWIRLYMIDVIGITITNCWKLFRFGVKRYYYEKLIGIR